MRQPGRRGEKRLGETVRANLTQTSILFGSRMVGDGDDSTNFPEIVKRAAEYNNFNGNFGRLAPQNPDTSRR
jgi:hypothetical protein